jgi:hypothetical protein
VLIEFDVADNELMGQIPDKLGMLANYSLALFNISGNLLSGTLPLDLCWLEAMSSLDFDCTPVLCGCS